MGAKTSSFPSRSRWPLNVSLKALITTAFYDVIEPPRPPALGSPEEADMEAGRLANHQAERDFTPLRHAARVVAMLAVASKMADEAGNGGNVATFVASWGSALALVGR